jgi:hypothetical protein
MIFTNLLIIFAGLLQISTLHQPVEKIVPFLVVFFDAHRFGSLINSLNTPIITTQGPRSLIITGVLDIILARAVVEQDRVPAPFHLGRPDLLPTHLQHNPR